MNTLPEYEVIRIFENGDDYFESLLKTISSAQKSIYIESYIFELPHPGITLLKLLEEKQKLGLDIKLMVDGVGSIKYLKELQTWSEETWIPLRIYNPLPWKHRWKFIFFPLFIINLIWHSRLLNKRDHRKMVIIDSYYAFIGSVNFAKSHFSRYSSIPWFDLSVQLQGSLISMLERAFLSEFERKKPSTLRFLNDLSFAFKNHPKWFPIEHKIRLNQSFVLRFLYWRDLLKRIRNAKSRVYIMNAYFVPHQTLLRSLRVAARKGVEVVILLPSESDVPVVKWFAPIFYRKLIQGGILIREIQNQMIHTKSLIIDDWALVGTNNLNYRSLIHDLEVDAVIDSEPMLQKLLSIWESKITESKIIQLNAVQKISWISWLRYRLVLLIRYFV